MILLLSLLCLADVPDPFRYLEDANDPVTIEWVEVERAVTKEFLEAIPGREVIRERLAELWNYERYERFFKVGGRSFYLKNDGTKNHSVVYCDDRVLLDPNEWSSDGHVSLSLLVPSKDGKWVGYSRSEGGSDWQEILVRNVETGVDLPERLEWVKFSTIAWTNEGFYYCRYDAPDEKTKYAAENQFQKVYFHKLGTEQSDDELVIEATAEKKWLFEPIVDETGEVLVVIAGAGFNLERAVFYKKPEGPLQELLPKFDAKYSYVGNVGTYFFFLTDLNAPNRRIIGIDLVDKVVCEIVPESEMPLVYVEKVGDRLIAHYLKDATSSLQVYGLDGQLEKTVPLPGLGQVQGVQGEEAEAFFSFTNYTQPTSIYRYDVASGDVELMYGCKAHEGYETKQVFYSSRDGTKIPMFLTGKKGLTVPAKTFLYGYGGFDISVLPGFSPDILAWLEMGGVYAVANLRGGGEYGQKWHEAGMLEKKQNVFDDFIAAAEWLIGEGITTPSRLAIGGRSNGGLLTGACLVQRPELFGAALVMVGVLDMLRFHRFTIGWFWTPEYGCADNPLHFPFLYKYSPLHNIKPVSYPPTMVMTADRDDRVVPAHSYKFGAALKQAQQGKAPILVRIDHCSGHGLGRPVSKLIDEAADKWSFLINQLE